MSKKGKALKINKLTPMQNGMLFHSLMDEEGVNYHEQMCYLIEGEIDPALLKQTWQELIDRHEIFRTHFMWEKVKTPVQVVVESKEVEFYEYDIAHLSESEQEEYIEAFKKEDLSNKFDFQDSKLNRLSILKLSNRKYLLCWSFHHILLDGWSVALITGQLFHIYSCLASGAPLPPKPVSQFSDYLDWLKNQNINKGLKFWEDYMMEFKEPTLLPYEREVQKNETIAKADAKILTIEPSEAQEIYEFCKKNNITTNTLFQTVWGIILQRYNNSSQSCFGMTVSGRPHELKNVEEIIGIFINTIPVIIKAEKGQTVQEVLSAVNEDLVRIRDYEYVPLNEIQKLSSSPENKFFDSIIAFENYPATKVVNEMNFDFHVSLVSVFELSNYDLALVIGSNEEIMIKFVYNSELFSPETVDRFQKHMVRLIQEMIRHPEASVTDICVLDEEEQQRLLVEWNQTKADYPRDKTIYQLFEEQVEKTPEAFAATFEQEQVTYRELNEKANQLARVLRTKGVGPNQIVGLMAERSLETVIGILGIIKAGGAYLPIDPEYPDERIEYMLQNSKATLCLTQKSLVDEINLPIDLMVLDDPDLYSGDGSNLDSQNHPEDLVYIIYTSGSTGNPKGVMIKHQGLVNYATWASKMYVRGEKVDFPLYSSLSFDLTVTSLYVPLITGNTIVIYGTDDKELLITKIVQEDKVQIIKLTPAHLQVLKNMNLAQSQIKRFIVGGEDLKSELAREIDQKFGGKVEIYNEYGPTETVVGCMIHCYDPERDTRQSVPIGIPADNVQIYLLDENLQPVTINVPGEIYISGDGVARGYLNREELTNERFVENPFIPGTKMYKTGDLARRLPNGLIEFLGRIDNQVKIRGYRIELGEIEKQLANLDLIQEALVIDWQNSNGDKALCAYLVTQEELNVTAIRETLAKTLPDYMIPAYFVKLDKIPLTNNGKVDRKALPNPESSLQEGKKYVAPTNEAEEKLAQIWAEVLGLEKVGIHDNFFELAGDSIKAIQILARANQHGLNIGLSDIFEYMTIADLIKNVNYSEDKEEIVQDEVQGEVPLTPIQRWFFELGLGHQHYYNHVNIFALKQDVDLRLLENVFRKLIEHHDALRISYKLENGEIFQYNRGIDEINFALEIVDLSAEPAEIQLQKLQEKSFEIQNRLDLAEGLLIQPVVFDLGEKGKRLLIPIHHLVIDGVSWRILLEDLQNLYHSELSEELPLKTTSFKEWSERLQEFSQTETLDLDYWNRIDPDQIATLANQQVQENDLKDHQSLHIEFDETQTTNLLTKINWVYNTGIDDLLLSALTMAITGAVGSQAILVTLEGHGREEILSEVDLTRTVGWFTSAYPVHLMRKENLVQTLKYVKDNLRRIPNKGMNYGIARYLQNNSKMQQLNPEISFNYLGQLDAGKGPADSLFGGCTEAFGPSTHPDNQASHLINFNSAVLGGKLQMLITYNSRWIDANMMKQIQVLYKESLEEIIGHCMGQRDRVYTASDFGLQKLLEVEDFDTVSSMVDLTQNTVYPLTSTQEGMLFHSLYDAESRNYCMQFCFNVEGEFQVDLFTQAWQEMINRHDIYKTRFMWKNIKTPVQIIAKEKTAEIYTYDMTELTPDEQRDFVNNLKQNELQKEFGFEAGQLNRISVVKLADDQHFICWMFHHIISDGWSSSIALADLFKIYSCLENGLALPEKPAAQFTDYLEWLKKQDQHQGLQFWKEYLADFTEATLVPADRKAGRGDVVSEVVVQTITLDEDKTQKIRELCQQLNITMSVFFQTAWGILLQKYHDVNQSCFGMTVAGRPHELNHVEEIVGILINTIPVVIQSDPQGSIKELLTRVNKQLVDVRKYEYLSLAEIQKYGGQDGKLFDSIIIFENYPINKALKEASSGIRISSDSSHELSNYNMSLAIMSAETTTIRLDFNAEIFLPDTMTRMRSHLTNVIEAMLAEPEVPVRNLWVLSEAEKTFLLDEFNDTATEYPHRKTVHQLFEEQVVKTPNQVAVIFGDDQLTYHELNAKANQFARLLREKGVQRNQIVALMVERSFEMVIGILGILKAGAAYLPIDSQYPNERIEYILKDSGATIFVIDKEKDFGFAEHTVIVLPELAEEMAQREPENLENVNTPDDLAYVIYTSGSTGKPKGVMIHHQGPVNYVTWASKVYLNGEKYNFPLYSSLSFDLTVTSIYVPLFTGNTIVIYGNDDSEILISKIIREDKVQAIKLTPAHLQIIKEMNFDQSNVKVLIVGGEDLKTELASVIYQKFNQNIKIYNEYGPTETVVGCMIHLYDETHDRRASVPIGVPADNVQIYLLNQALQPVPIGIPGEIYISGDGVAKGYLHRPELTAEKFIENPFMVGKMMYKTGDLAQRLPDGRIEFLGRIDSQVKIRGYRIELGEIEHQLLSLAAVQDAVVIDREINGDKQLCAYLVTEREFELAELREYLKDRVPEYMIPAYFVSIEKMPLTPNGKVDRKALPDPTTNLSGTTFVEATTELERKLVQIWSEVLGVEKIGIHDSFFALAGDSIKAIQILARANQSGINISLKDIFTHLTIAELVKNIDLSEEQNEISQEEVIGEAPLTPIQKWFFELGLAHPHYYNQSNLFSLREDVDLELLENVFYQLLEHHDGLRMSYEWFGDQIIQYNRALDECDWKLEYVDLSEYEETAQAAKLREICVEFQQSFDLRDSTLIKMVVFNLGTRGKRLLIPVHHLVMDGVSWRILMEDLQNLYHSELNQELPLKTTSFKEWSEKLTEYAETEELDVAYWEAIDVTRTHSFVTNPVQENYVKDHQSIMFEFGTEHTKKLLTEVNQAFNTGVDDILLSALAMAYTEVTGSANVLLTLEGHGREELFSDVDISRTIGWFTSEYPVNLPGKATIESTIKHVKENLRRIPNKGLNYGIARYLQENPKLQQINPEIAFNYLGQISGVTKKADDEKYLLSGCPESAGPNAHAENQVSHLLNISGIVRDSKLQMAFTFNARYLDAEIIKELQIRYQRYLEEIIDYCAQKRERTYTASDFGMQHLLDVEELDGLLLELDLAQDKIYPLTPIQEGMLFHNILDPEGRNYHVQFCFVLEGELNVDHFKTAWQELINRHEVYRTNFIWENLKHPIQIIRKEKAADIFQYDITALGTSEQESYLARFKEDDLQKNFDFVRGSLNRLSLIKLASDRYFVCWALHHIISDGWSSSIAIGDFFKMYHCLQNGLALPEKPVAQFTDYLEWLKEQNKDEGIKFWKTYMAGFEEPTCLPDDQHANPSRTIQESLVEAIVIDEDQASKITEMCQSLNITVNAFFQTAWGVLLQKYNNTDQSCFGMTVSGRPHELEHVEEIVGIMINTIPIVIRTDEGKTVQQLLSRVNQELVEIRAYEYMQLADIQKLGAQSVQLFDSILVFENFPMEKTLQDVRIGFRVIPESTFELSNYDMTLVITSKNKININMYYNTARFTSNNVRTIREHFMQVVNTMLTQVEMEVRGISLLSDREKSQVLDEFNATTIDYPRDQVIHQLFEEVVRKMPDKAAVVFEEQLLTYQELHAKSNQLARVLRAKGVGPDQIVGIMVKPSLEMMIGVLAIIKAGGAYLPIDMEYPQSRIEFMLNDASVSVLLVEEGHADRIQFAGEIIHLSDPMIYQGDSSNLENINRANDLIYVIYTSGSTGEPKGVMIEHYNVSRLVFNVNTIVVEEDDRILQTGSLAFDASTFEIWGTFLKGATLYLTEKDNVISASRFAELLSIHQISMLWLTAPLFNQIVEENPASFAGLRKLIVGGDALSPKHINLAREHNRLLTIINGYGPTESTTFTTCFEIQQEYKHTIPIGKPLSNTRLYIVGQDQNLQPIGVAGELWIAGDGLARGYLNRPDLTEEKFIQTPLIQEERMYRTGDLCRWLPDGNIEFLGRIDHQVKIRGYRIELGEIESQLLWHHGVKEAKVVDFKDAKGEKNLCAYLVTEDGMDISEIREYLAERLPAHMIPAYFIIIDKMPLTPNGKIDHKALPDPTERTGGAIIAPRNAVEAELLKIWQAVLGIEAIGVTDDFFEIGGHSLKATRLAAQISKTMHVEVALKEIFENPTIVELAELIAGKEESSYSAIDPVAEQEYYPASSAQKRLFVIDQLETDSMTYNMPLIMIIEEALDVERLEDALNTLIQRHEALRTSFALINGEVVQKVRPELEFTINKRTATEDQLNSLIAQFVRPFDLSQAPLFRVELAKFGEDQYLLMMDTHHIISDGVSQSIFFSELIKLYMGEELPELRIQYKDFAVWQNQFLQSETMNQQEQYWLNTFAGELPVLNLPLDYPRPAVTNFAGDVLTFTVDQELARKLNQLARQNGATLYMVTLAAVNVLMSKYSGQEDIIVGSVIAGRAHSDLANILGMFVNTLPHRNKPQRTKSFEAFLRDVKDNALRAYENQDYQFEMLVDKLKLERDLGRNPLFDVMFDLHLPDQQQVQNYLKCKPYSFNVTTAKFDLDLMGVETQNGIHFTLIYRSDLFMRATIETMVKHFVNILNVITTNPEIEIAAIEMITEEEKEQVLFKNNSKTLPYPKDKVFHQLFEEQVEKTPDQLAVIFRDQQLTYRELNQKANQLAHLLREKGVMRDQIIGVLVERSLEMIISVMAILKAGAAYLPIDPEYPEDRVAYMIQDSNAQIVLTQKHLAGKVNSTKEVIYMSEELYTGDHSNPAVINQPSDLAYVVYTSGSTGRPKGVLIQHNHFVNIAWGWYQEYHLDELQVNLLQMASFSFDVFAGDLARTLLSGGNMVICPADVRIDYPTLYELAREHRITLFEATPSLVIPFMEYVYANQLPMDYLKLLILGSDSCRVEDFKKLLSRYGKMMRIINSYGVSEATIDSSYYEESLEKIPETGNVPIGKPLPNVTMYVLGNGLELKPTGIYGELYIGGDSVARGYHNRPDLNAERFVENPHVPGERIYKTGDVARWLPDGNIEFVGRTDFQVKIRGYRIETGEIENQLLAHPVIKEAVVIDRTDSTGTKYLCGYIVTDQDLSLADLRNYLGERLPEYMIPAHFVKLNKLPLTPNGKIDRKGLPEPDGSIATGVEYIAPADAVEEKLAQIFSEILAVEKVGVIDDFFEIGGHSLRAMQLVTKIHSEFNVNIPLRDIFKTSTVKDLAKYIKGAEKVEYVHIQPVEAREFYPTSSAQKRLYLMRQLGTGIEYNMPAAWSIKERLDEAMLEKAIQALVQRHESLRTSFELLDGELIQRIHPDINYELKIVEATPEEIPNILSEFVQPFDLSKPPLFRIQYVQSISQNLLLVDMHHIISDGVSDDILIREFAALYQGQALPELPIQYKDYAVWENETLQSGQLKKQEEYWLAQFAGEIPVLNMPTDYSRTLANSSKGRNLAIVIEEDLTRKIKELVAEHDVTLYMVLLAACNILFAKYTDQEDIIIGSPVAGRTHADLENIIGVFINSLAMKNHAQGDKTFAAFLAEVKENALRAYENQNYPFDLLVERLQLQRDSARNPLFDVSLSVQTLHAPAEGNAENLMFKPVNLDFTVARFDFRFSATEVNNKIYVDTEYKALLYKEETVEQILNNYLEILNVIAENSHIKLKDIQLLDELKEVEKVKLTDVEFDF